MLKLPFIEDDQLWRTICFLESLEDELPLIQVCHELEVDEECVQQAIYFFQQLNVHFQLQDFRDEMILVPPKEREKVKFELGLSEWIALQAHFPLMEAFKGKAFHESLINKLSEIEKDYRDKDFFSLSRPKETLEEIVSDLDVTGDDNDLDTMKILDQAVIDKSLVSVSLKSGMNFKVFPHKIVYLIGELCLIGEDESDHSLMQFSLDELAQVSLDQKEGFSPQFTAIEVRDFIEGQRSMENNQIRLVLKIKGGKDFKLPNKFQYIKNPYVVTNWEGDYIWSGSLEINQDIYHWLECLDQDVIVLDPAEVREKLDKKNLAKSKKLKKSA